MKTTGKLWKEFLDSWPEGQWYDDSDVSIDGTSEEEIEGVYSDSAIVEFTGGAVFPKDWEGGEKYFALASMFKKWLKQKETTVVICEIPNDAVGELKQAVLKLKGKVIK